MPITKPTTWWSSHSRDKHYKKISKRLTTWTLGNNSHSLHLLSKTYTAKQFSLNGPRILLSRIKIWYDLSWVVSLIIIRSEIASKHARQSSNCFFQAGLTLVYRISSYRLCYSWFFCVLLTKPEMDYCSEHRNPPVMPCRIIHLSTAGKTNKLYL